MAVTINDVTLNILSAIIVSVIIATHVRRDMIVAAFIMYTILFIITFFVPGGGQLNAGGAMASIVFALLSWTTEDMITTTTSMEISQYEKVPIVEGYLVINAQTNLKFDTYDPLHTKYRRLSLSQNRVGGLQYTYVFWLNTKINTNLVGKTILHRGDGRKFAPQVKYPDATAFENMFSNTRDITIAGPRIYFKEETILGVQLNTDNQLLVDFEIGNKYKDLANQKNILNIISNKWVMISVIIEDNVAINEFENGISVKVYINDYLYDVKQATGSVRPNEGPLHLLTSQTSNEVWPADSRIADVSYFNYALSDAHVRRLFNKGFTNKASSLSDRKKNNDTLELGPYNKLDYSNTTVR